MSHWGLFRRDRFYLIKYLMTHLVFILAMIAFLSKKVDGHFLDITFKSWMVLLLIPASILAVQIPVLIHNCVHRNLRPRWLNFVAGEIAGMYVLLSMAAFELNHVMHHAHNDTELDPHNPQGKNFFVFFLANNFGGGGVVFKKYTQYHGETFSSKALFALIMFLHFFNVVLRLGCWFLLLGPSLFIFVFAPSYLFHIFVFSHINYVTHETTLEGTVLIHNKNSNIYYKFVNFFGSGVYFHKNHHLNVAVYNPMLGAKRNGLLR